MSLRGRPAGAAAAVVRSFLLVRCADTALALPAEIVQGFYDHRAWEPGRSPDRSPDDLGRRIGLGPTPADAERPVVLVGAGGGPIPFLVDEVVGMVDVPPGAIHPLPAHFAEAERGRFVGLFLTGRGLAVVVNGWWLAGREPAAPPSAAWLEAPAPDLSPAPSPEVTEAETVAYDGPPARATALRPGRSAEDPAAPAPDWLDRLEVEEAADDEDAPWAEL